MSARLVVALVLLALGVIFFGIGAAGTFSVVQVVIGIFLAGIGAIALVKAIGN